MLVSIYHGGKEIARGEADGQGRIGFLEPVEGRGMSYGRRVSITALSGPHKGETYVLKITEDAGEEIGLDGWPWA